MKVDNKLLEKYYNGFCNKAEQSVVEGWLASNNFDNSEVLNLPENESKKVHKEKMWEDISQVFNKPIRVIPLYKKMTRYTVASCLVIGLVVVSVLELCNVAFMSMEMAYNNTGATKKQYQSIEMDFALTPNSEVDVVTNLCKTKSEIVFCGNMELTNKMDGDVQYTIQSICSLSKNDSTRKVTLKKDERYFVFAIKDKKGNEKIHIYNKEDVLMFFPPGRIPRHILKATMV